MDKIVPSATWNAFFLAFPYHVSADTTGRAWIQTFCIQTQINTEGKYGVKFRGGTIRLD